MSDLIRREDVVKEFGRVFGDLGLTLFGVGGNDLAQVIANAIPSAEREGEWIPCSERLPEDLEVVNITWVNHRPMTYYADIKDEPFTATAIHYKDKWWWYSPICEDLLAEYGKSECDKMDADIEVTAWMPLPKPYGEREGE